MYVIGEKVVYGAQGVMEIVDIVDQTIGDATRRYYVLREYSSPSSSSSYASSSISSGEVS
jgi:RNA polymerase-interacting CarD/CdnL/TRCF family regulator